MAATRSYQCTCCGKTVNTDMFDIRKPLVKDMVRDRICFECRFWKEYISNPTPDTCIVSGKLMMFHPIRGWQKQPVRRKHGMIYAQDMRTGEGVCSMEYRHIGTIPEHFHSLLPDDFRLISLDTYERMILRQDPICRMKGCYDRYECWWYHQEISEPDGAWNKIFGGHKTGDENCESFINKNEMYI